MVPVVLIERDLKKSNKHYVQDCLRLCTHLKQIIGNKSTAMSEGVFSLWSSVIRGYRRGGGWEAEDGGSS